MYVLVPCVHEVVYVLLVVLRVDVCRVDGSPCIAHHSVKFCGVSGPGAGWFTGRASGSPLEGA